MPKTNYGQYTTLWDNYYVLILSSSLWSKYFAALFYRPRCVDLIVSQSKKYNDVQVLYFFVFYGTYFQNSLEV